MNEPMPDAFAQHVRGALGPDDGDMLIRLALPAIRLEHSVDPVGRSRLGGVPLMEPAQVWPTWGPRPLSFVAVLDLEDLAGFDLRLSLPPEGLLNFFYEADEQMAWGFDPEHADGWRVLFADATAAEERQRPDGALEFNKLWLRSRPVVTLPDPFEDVVDDIRTRHDDAFYDVLEQWQTLTGIDEPRHQVGGWPYLVQNPLQRECQLASNGIYCGNGNPYSDPANEQILQGAADWRLLLQLDSDDDAGWMWGDCGSLYFCVKSNKADAPTLDAAWMIFQCS